MLNILILCPHGLTRKIFCHMNREVLLPEIVLDFMRMRMFLKKTVLFSKEKIVLLQFTF